MIKRQILKFATIFCLSFVIASFARGLELGTTSAAVPCKGKKFLYVGTDPKTINVVAVKADISSVNPPALCGAAWSSSSIWVMLASGDPDACKLAQVGYLRFVNDQTIKVFAEHGQNCKKIIFPVIMFDAPPGNHSYIVSYKRPANPAKRRAHMWFDNTRVLKTNFDPEVAWGGQPWSELWEAETHDEGDDVPGTVNIPAFFANMGHKVCKGCQWVEPVGLTLGSSSNRYDANWDNSHQFHVWTK